MKKIILLLCFLLSFSLSNSFGQYTIKGTIKDTVYFTPTYYTSVSLIQASDSTLIDFTRTDESDQFVLNAPKADKFILLISHPNFIEYNETISVLQATTDLGEIPMLSKRYFLEEVVIKDHQKIVVKGDTVEFNADSFQTRAYDNVDELLKKLPGIEVSKDGTITAYGEKVQKMLVDGEEFFSDDPAVVMKTLRASSVDRVQVFDKKSDQAEFTGIDDGEKIKTINLKLKDNAKTGYFGKVNVGGGLPKYWENQAMFNTFTPKRKFSVYGTMSNTNLTGLSFQDQRSFGGRSGGMRFNNDDDGSSGLMIRESFESGDFNGQGIPRTISAGTHYSNKWFEDKLKTNASYRFNKTDIEALNNSVTQYILPDTQYIVNNDGERISHNQTHNLYVNNEYDIDSSSSIRLVVSGSYGFGNSKTNISSQSNSLEGGLINKNENNQSSENNNKSANANLFYRKKFDKDRRTFSANLVGGWSENESNGFLNSKYQLFAIDSSYNIQQKKESNGNNVNLNARFTYTEPIADFATLELNYSLLTNNNKADNFSYDDDGIGGVSDVMNPFYSSSYEYNSMNNQGGANVRFNWDKIKIMVGGNMSYTQYNQKDFILDTSYSYGNMNFFPRANFRYEKSRQNSFGIYYNGRTQAPSINQIAPLRNNSDPMNIAIGNPDLKQSFMHNINVNYYQFKMLTGQYFALGANMTMTQNAITQAQNIDISGIRTYQYINTNGNMFGYLYAYFGMRNVKGFSPGFNLSTSYSRANDFINSQKNISSILALNPSASLRYDKDTTFSLSYRFSPSYNNSSQSVRKDIKTSYWIFNQSFDGSINLPLGFVIGSDVNWEIRQKIQENETNNKVFAWNAYLSKFFLKDRSLVAQLYAHDILNQNKGYNRFNAANQISETNYNTIRRYIMLKVTWNFTKSGSKKPQDNAMMILGN